MAGGARQQELNRLLIGGSGKAFAQLSGRCPGNNAHSTTRPADHHLPVFGDPVLKWIRYEPAALVFWHRDLGPGRLVALRHGAV